MNSSSPRPTPPRRGLILAGIDEAGLGPVLGPLVVSMSVFRVPPGEGDETVGPSDLWEMLRACIAPRPARGRKRPGKIVIADSKRLFSRKSRAGLAPLERGVLTMLAARELSNKSNKSDKPAPPPPATLGDLLRAVSPEAVPLAAGYPWYGPCALALPLRAEPTELALAGNAVRVGLRDAEVRLLELACEPVFVGQFNQRVAATRNKSTLAFGLVSQLLMRLWRATGDEPLHITIDRQGGRIRYRPPLQRVFAGCELKVLEESEQQSAYRIRSGAKTAELLFTVGAEEKSLPVALGSMLSKYVRELCMEQFNRFWASHVESLEPTAGYYVDGRRFYAAIQPAMTRLNIPPELIYRSR